MILYFADRKMNILGLASTELPEGITISDDTKTEEIDEGVAVLEFDLFYDPAYRKKAETWTEAGNYILRKEGNDREFYTIISRENNPVDGSVNVYAEDAGLDLLNEVVGEYTADQAHPIAYYIEKFSYDSGFEIGLNEISDLNRKLSWDGEATATERLLSVATQFDNAEINFSFEVDGLSVVHKYINIYKKRGVDAGVQLRIGREIKDIRIKDTIEDLATAYLCTGGIPDGEDNAITLEGYKYDDGDFYVEGSYVKSRKALEKWSRYQVSTETKKDDVGHIVKTFTYDTTSQSELCNRAVSSLKKICDVSTSYEVELEYLPEGTKIGDTVYIIDAQGELYLSSRLLKIETSVCNDTKTAELGEYKKRSSGISDQVQELADAFAKVAQNRNFYTWVVFGDTETGSGITLDSSGKKYMGIAYNQTTRQPILSDPEIYTWVKVVGEQGIVGAPGKDGLTSFFHVRYADVQNPTSSQMKKDTGKYIGTYADYTFEDSADPTKYTWRKFQGDDGQDGADGVPGINGINGETSYLHIAYATSPDGKNGFSITDSVDKTYIGQYVDFVIADSTDPGKYSWSKFQGPKGEKGERGLQGISGEDAVLLYISSSKGNVFKNNAVSTDLKVVIFRGKTRITNIDQLHAEFGDAAYLQWKSQLNENDDYLLIPPIDERISDGGFTFTISPDDIDTKGVYTCDLMDGN